MSYKNAMADLEFGGGKAVIIGDSRTQKPRRFSRPSAARSRASEALLDGRDVGVSPSDLMHARKSTPMWPASGPHRASGDPSPSRRGASSRHYV